MKSPRVLLLTALAIGSATGQTINIQPAVRVEFEASAGKYQVLEKSSDLIHWSPAAPGLVGPAQTVGNFFSADTSQQYYRISENEVADVSAELETLRATHNLPALGCAVVMSNRIVGLGVTGIRKHGISEPVTLGDLWHHGSTTKSMTAVLAAKMVEEGLISWTTKLVDLFPEHAATRNPGWNTVTLEMLLSNSAGAPTDLNPSGIFEKLVNHPGTPREQRLFLTQELTKLPPRFTPGESYEYSNAGFSMAGAMLEEVAGRPWEDLMKEKVFTPLGMLSAGFGVPATPRYINHPWGHTFSGTTPVPVAPGPGADNPPGIGPGGTVHCSLVDFARYIAFHLAGARGEGDWLQPATYQKLYTPVNQNYALGWITGTQPWSHGPYMTHDGSNTQWRTSSWIVPGRNWAVVVVTNIGGAAATTACGQTVTAMFNRFMQ